MVLARLGDLCNQLDLGCPSSAGPLLQRSHSGPDPEGVAEVNLGTSVLLTRFLVAVACGYLALETDAAVTSSCGPTVADSLPSHNRIRPL
jgi:hypothetical protein